jgi:hypothetical protein
MADDEAREGLTPNAILILLAVDASRVVGRASSKSDGVAWTLGKDAAWMHRHGKAIAGPDGLVDLSPNGHVSTTARGKAVARRLRALPPASPPPDACRCGAGRRGPCVGGRQMFGCGKVAQWCPDSVPWLPPVEIAARSRRAHHDGLWFEASPCGRLRLSYGRTAPRSETSDGTPLVPGLPVEMNHGSGQKHRLGGEVGEVVAAAEGKALVSWPASFERSALEAEIVDSVHLVVPGMVDETGLSDHQEAVLRAARIGDATFLIDVDGRWSGQMGGRAINPRTIQILVERGLLEGETAEAVPVHRP